MNEIGQYTIEDAIADQQKVNAIGAIAAGSYGSAAATSEQLAKQKAMDESYRCVVACRASMERIHSALDSTLRGDISPLGKSDLQNAARHATALAKKIRELTASLYPTVPREKTETAETTKQ